MHFNVVETQKLIVVCNYNVDLIVVQGCSWGRGGGGGSLGSGTPQRKVRFNALAKRSTITRGGGTCHNLGGPK